MKLESIGVSAEVSREWFFLDTDYYLRQCVLKGIAIQGTSEDVVRQHFIQYSGMGKLSPNIFFDEAYYRALYPSVDAEIQKGRFTSGFDHFVQSGAEEGLSPAWFFSGAWFLSANSDVTPDFLRFRGLSDVYSYFLSQGIADGRGGMWLTALLGLFKPREKLLRSAEQLAEALRNPQVLADYLLPLFDAAWFAAKYQTAGDVRTDIRTYLDHAGSERLSPNATFDEGFYLDNNPDVAEAVAAGHFSSGYRHFLFNGMYERRAPLAGFDAGHYVSRNPGVAQECDKYRLTPYQHFLLFRKSRVLEISPPFSSHEIAEAAGKGIFERRAVLVSATFPIDLRQARPPVASIIIIARNKFAETYQCIMSVAQGTRVPFEIILYDNASTDEIATIRAKIPGLVYMRSPVNKGFTIPVNQAAEIAKGSYLVLVNNDTEVGPGAVDRAVGVLERDSSIGVVGGKIVRTHGLLQEAGSIVWNDGSCLGYARDTDPLGAATNFPRDVDFCSGCFLAMRKDEWQALGGFDVAYAPAYYEETDYCLRVWQSGKRVVYDPAITLWHFEFGSSTLPGDAIALMQRNRSYFERKHAKYLEACLEPSEANIEAARMRLMPRPRVLFVEDYMPQASMGMGFVRSSKVLSILVDACGHVTAVGLHPTPGKIGTDNAVVGDNIERLADFSHLTAADFLARRRGVYDVLWLSRTHNLKFLANWKKSAPAFFDKLRVVVDTEAIAALRTAAQARLLGIELDVEQLIDQELAGIAAADTICVVNDIDRDAVEGHLRRKGVQRQVVVLGHALTPTNQPPEFDATSGIYMVGSFADHTGPNADAARWFDKEVRPLLSAELSAEPIVVAGFKAQEFVEAAGLSGSYKVLSNIENMASLYAGARVVIAPTRFAGGIPFKVHEAASHGVPVVMTALLGRQVGWLGESALGIAAEQDPADFARHIARLYFDRKAWEKARKRQLALVAEDCGEEGFARTVFEVLWPNASQNISPQDHPETESDQSQRKVRIIKKKA